MSILMKVEGQMACFTVPYNKRGVSYPCMTPSAAVGCLSNILWKPEFKWDIEEIRIIRKGEYYDYMTSIPERLTQSMKCSDLPGTDRKRTTEVFLPQDLLNVTDSARYDRMRSFKSLQVLVDVAYIVKARVHLTKLAGPGCNVKKYEEMFKRRLEKGKCDRVPYLGLKEFTALCDPVTEEDKHDTSINMELDGFLYSPYYQKDGDNKPLYISEIVKDGVLNLDYQRGHRFFKIREMVRNNVTYQRAPGPKKIDYFLGNGVNEDD